MQNKLVDKVDVVVRLDFVSYLIFVVAQGIAMKELLCLQINKLTKTVEYFPSVYPEIIQTIFIFYD